MDENGLSKVIIGAAIEVHRFLGPGLLENVYRQCLAQELGLLGIRVAQEVPISASYKGADVDLAYRLDMLVADRVVVELKVVEQLQKIHEAQLLSYLRLSGKRLGLLINFNVTQLRGGIRRVVNGL
ncbi:MAG: GxxExxY protein [Gammaproteobacteria bacterium HGW-Gammaproteobacteria-1]|jgi:GxxExxY protein|nr:MAG: GxxExxY protein [Gammaproteobacteria bacterium HGW-Gammaproteobacteria-1]